MRDLCLVPELLPYVAVVVFSFFINIRTESAYQIMLPQIFIASTCDVLESEEELEPKSSHVNVINIHGSII